MVSVYKIIDGKYFIAYSKKHYINKIKRNYIIFEDFIIFK